MFESDFLTSAPESKLLYRELMTRVTELIGSCFPPQPYAGKSPAALSALINPAFLPDEAAVPDAVFEQLGGFISNSLAVSHPNSAAHLHSPPLLATLAAEAVISALNQSLDSFDLGPVATMLGTEIRAVADLRGRIAGQRRWDFHDRRNSVQLHGLASGAGCFPEITLPVVAQKQGLPPEAARMRVLCSEVAHFTVEKSAAQLGWGPMQWSEWRWTTRSACGRRVFAGRLTKCETGTCCPLP